MGVVLKKIQNCLNKNWCVFALLCVIGISIYANVLNAPFIWDDLATVSENKQITSFFHIKEWFTTSSVSGANVPESNLYRPLVKTIDATIFQIFELRPFAYRGLNIILHILNAFLVFCLFSRLKFARTGSVLAALLFLVHPVQVESVTYISGLPDVLAPFFMLSGLLLFMNRKNLGALGLLILALLSKELSIIFFALAGLLAIYKWTSYDKKIKSEKIKWLCIYAGTTAAYIILRFTVLNFTGSFHLTIAMQNVYTESLLVRVITFISTLYEYIKLIIFPVDLFFEKIFRPTETLATFKGIFGLIIVIGGLGLTYNSWIKNKKFFLGFLWFFICLAPVSGMIVSNAIYTEHWLYMPFIGILIGIPFIWEYLKTKKAHAIFLSLFLIITLTLSIRTISRNTEWADPQTFYENEIAHNPYSPRTFSQLGTIHFAKRNFNRAAKAFEKGIENDVDQEIPQLHFNLGNTYYHLNRLDDAEQQYLKALEINPDYTKAKNMLNTISKEKNESN